MGQLNNATPAVVSASGGTTVYGAAKLTTSNRVSTTTPAADSEVTLTVAAAGTYIMRTDFNFYPSGSGAGGCGVKVSFQYSGTVTAQQTLLTVIHDANNPVNYAENTATIWNSSFASVSTLASFGTMIQLVGYVTFSTSGSATVSYSQASSTANPVYFAMGSTWTLTKIS
jgi:hypothetical protein